MSSFLRNLDVTISFIMAVLALISTSFFPLFSFLWELLPTHARSSCEDHSNLVSILECQVLPHNCARVLYGAVLEEASWPEPPSSHWFLKSCCILSSIWFFFPLGVGGGRHGGGFCVLSLFFMYGLVKVSYHGQLTSWYWLADFG